MTFPSKILQYAGLIFGNPPHSGGKTVGNERTHSDPGWMTKFVKRLEYYEKGNIRLAMLLSPISNGL